MVMKTTKFTNEQEVYLRLPLVVTDMDLEDGTFYVENGELDISTWVHGDYLFALGDDSELPLVPTDLVRPKFNSADRFGRIVSISKGFAWVDWAPGTDDSAFGAHQISGLVRLTEAEITELEKSGRNVRALAA